MQLACRLGIAPSTVHRILADAHLNRLRVDKSVVLRTITRDGIVVGSIVAWDTGHTPQIGFAIDPARWGEGIATAALISFTALMKRRPLQASVAADNPASVRLHERHGFRLVGTYEAVGFKFDRWIDIVHMQKHL